MINTNNPYIHYFNTFYNTFSNSNTTTNFHTYLNQNLHPFLQNLTAEQSINLITNTLGGREIEEVERETGDTGETINIFLIYIQNHYKKIQLIDNSTGELLSEISLTNTNNWKEEAAHASSLLSSSDGIDTIARSCGQGYDEIQREKNELENGEVLLGTPAMMKNCLTYKHNGIRHHKISFSEAHSWFFDEYNDCLPHLKFTDMDGKITDLFFGSYNDFDSWFSAKAARGDRFKVFISDNGHDWNRVCTVHIYIPSVDKSKPSPKMELNSDVAGTWAVV